MLTWIVAAREAIEDITHRQLVTAQWSSLLDAFPAADVLNPDRQIVVPRGELQSINSLTYIDVNGDTQTLVEDTDFIADPSGDYVRIVPIIDTTWPATQGRINTVTLTWTCGYGDNPADVPEEIRNQIKEMVSSWDEVRDSQPFGTRSRETIMRDTARASLSHYIMPELG